MIIFITGATHTGKTRLAQRLLEQKKMPYVSQDHIKMGLIRSGYTSLTPDTPDRELTAYLWPVTREMVKTAIENEQNLIVEGCYIPFDWKNDFDEEYLKKIEYICVCFSDEYIDEHYADIIKYEGCIEKRLDDGYLTKELLKSENGRFREQCAQSGLSRILIETQYERDLERGVKDLWPCREEGERWRNRSVVIALRDGRVLMERVDDHGRGFYTIPGGGIEPGETPEQAALRELKEECGLDGKIVRKLAELYNHGRTEYAFEVKVPEEQKAITGFDPEHAAGEQPIKEVCWMTLKELPEKDRAYLWKYDLLDVGRFAEEAQSWGDEISYPGTL